MAWTIEDVKKELEKKSNKSAKGSWSAEDVLNEINKQSKPVAKPVEIDKLSGLSYDVLDKIANKPLNLSDIQKRMEQTLGIKTEKTQPTFEDKFNLLDPKIMGESVPYLVEKNLPTNTTQTFEPKFKLIDPKSTEKVGSYLGEKAKQGLMSFGEGWESFKKIIENKTEPFDVFDPKQLYREDVKKQKQEFAEAEKSLHPALKLTGDVIGGFTQMIPTLLTSMVNPLSGLLTIGGSAAGNAAQEATDSGASKEQALLYGLTVGGIEGAVEGLVGGLPFMKGIADKTVKSILKPIKSRIVKTLTNRAIDAGGEALEEIISGLLQPIAQKAIYDPKAQFPKVSELLYEGGVAAIIAGTLGLPSSAVEIYKSIKTTKDVEIKSQQASDIAQGLVGTKSFDMITKKPLDQMEMYEKMRFIVQTRKDLDTTAKENSKRLAAEEKTTAKQATIEAEKERQRPFFETLALPEAQPTVIPQGPIPLTQKEKLLLKTQPVRSDAVKRKETVLDRQRQVQEATKLKTPVIRETPKMVTVAEAEKMKLKPPTKQAKAEQPVKEISPETKIETKQITEKPKKTFKPIKQKVSKFKLSLEKSYVIPEEIKTKLTDEEFLYETRSNKKDVETAYKRVERDLDGEMNRLLSDTQKPSESPIDSMEIFAVADKLVRDGRINEAKEFVVAVRPKVTATAQSLQALAIRDKLSPGGILITATKMYEDSAPKETVKKAKGEAKQVTDAMNKVNKDSIDDIIKKLGGDVSGHGRKPVDIVQKKIDSFTASVSEKIYGGRPKTGADPYIVSSETRPDIKAARQISDALGLDVIFIKPQTKTAAFFNGVYHNGTIFINANADNAAHIVLGHEVMEQLAKESPETFNEFVSVFKKEIDNTKAAQYRKSLAEATKKELGNELTDEEFYKEAAGDFSGEMFNDPQVMTRLAKENPNIAEKIIQIVRDIISKLRAIVNPDYQVRKYLNDAQAVEDAYVKTTGKFVQKLRAPSKQGTEYSVKRGEAFDKWFGDSKVVDEKGQPLVVYHGTDAKFNIFKSSQNEYFLTSSLKASKDYGYIPMKLYLSMKNPLAVDFKGKADKNIFDYIDKAKSEGKDGVIAKNTFDGANTHDQYVVFKPTQIKSATSNIGTYDPENPDIRYSIRRGTEAPKLRTPSKQGTEFSLKRPVKTFYSKLERAIEEKMPNSADVVTIGGIIKSAGIKGDEIKWSGITEFLREKEKVSKQELLDFLRGNQLEIQEVTKDKETKFQQYTLPGGENYREVLFTLPGKKSIPSFERWVAMRINTDNYFDDMITLFSDEKVNFFPRDLESQKALYEKEKYPMYDQDYSPYTSLHWGEKNVLAHTRLTDRVDTEGNKVLFVEEIQSDWHQEGRKKGYKNHADNVLPEGYIIKREEDTGMYDRERKYFWRIYDSDGKIVNAVSTNKYSKEEAIIDTNIRVSKVKKIPNAPFSKTWHEFVLRRMLRYAAENGYDKIALTTGEQQAERYDLSKQVESVYFNKKGYEKKDNQIWVVVKSFNNPNNLIEKYMTPEETEATLGKEISKKIIEGEERGTLTGIDLKVGGEGMKGFYDKIIPEYLNKYGKKWGSKVEDSNINLTGISKITKEQAEEGLKSGDVTKQPSIPITEAMRESVLYEGQPLYSIRRGTEAPQKFQSPLDRIIKKSLRESGVDIRDIARKHYTERDLTGKSLSDKLTEQAGLTGEEAKKFADIVQKRFSELTESKKRSILNQLYKTRTPSQRKALEDRIIELSNMGAIGDSKYTEILYEKYGIPQLDEKTAKSIIDQAEQIQKITDVFKRQAAINKMMAEIKSKIPAGAAGKLRAYTLINVLLNPKTIGSRNILGNISQMTAMRINKYLMTSIDFTRSKLTGKDRTITFRTTRGLIEPVKQFMSDVKIGGKAGWEGYSPYGTVSEFRTATQQFRGKYNPFTYLEKALGASLGGAGDYPFYMKAVLDSVGEQSVLRAINEGYKGKDLNIKAKEYADEVINSALNISDFSREVLDKANRLGEKATFRDPNVVSTILKETHDVLNVIGFGETKRTYAGKIKSKQYGAGDLAIFFSQTPGSLLNIGFEYSPLGILKSAYHVLSGLNKARKGTGGIDYEKVTESITKAVTGTLLMSGFAAYLTSKGAMTGGGTDDWEAERFLDEQGKRQYSVNRDAVIRWAKSLFKDDELLKTQEGDTWFNYDWLSPFSFNIALGADAAETLKQREKPSKPVKLKEVLPLAWQTGLKTLYNENTVRNLIQPFRGYELDKSVWNTLVGSATRFVPLSSMLNMIRQMTDNVKRNVSSDDPKIKVMNLIKNRIPGLSKTLPATITTTGNVHEMYQGGTNNFLNVVLNPAFVKKYKETPGTKLLIDLYESTGETKQFPRIARDTLSIYGQEVELTKEQIADLQQYIGYSVMFTVDNLTKNKAFNKLSDNEKVDVIYNVLNEAGDNAKDYMAKKLNIKKIKQPPKKPVPKFKVIRPPVK